MSEHHESRLPSPRELKAQIDAEQTGQPFLLWRDGGGAQHILMLSPDRARVTIGRREQSDIALAGTRRSRAHTRCSSRLARSGRWSTMAFAKRLVRQRQPHPRPHRLADRETMCFGKTRVVYREPNSATRASRRRVRWGRRERFRF